MKRIKNLKNLPDFTRAIINDTCKSPLDRASLRSCKSPLEINRVHSILLRKSKMYRTTFDNERKQWNGQMTKSDFNPNASLGNVILNSLLVQGSRVAQVN